MNAEQMVERFITNVRAVGKAQGRLGLIERQAGVTTGYLSRCVNSQAKISFLTALKLAETTGESVMDLCTQDYETKVIDSRIKQLEQEISALKEEKNRRIL